MPEKYIYIDQAWEVVYPIIARLVPAETAHEATIFVLKKIQEHPILLHMVREMFSPVEDERLRTEIVTPGRVLSFDNPISIAAGMDKNIEAIVAFILGLNAAGVEGGALTVEPQQGNDGERLIRVVQDMSLINRMGFNNVGLAIGKQNLGHQRDLLSQYDSKYGTARIPIIGVNIGPNKTTVQSGDTSAVIDEYLSLMDELSGLADYLVINISSPNTPGLRLLQEEAFLFQLLSQIKERRDDKYINTGEYVPYLVKLSPDENLQTFANALWLMQEAEADGVILTNTTMKRPVQYSDREKLFKGGVSGPPLYYQSLNWVTLAHQFSAQHNVESEFPIIGVGGIDSWQDVVRMMLAGASHTQLYTSLVYHGPGHINSLLRGLSHFMDVLGDRTQIHAISDIVGKYHDDSIREVFEELASESGT